MPRFTIIPLDPDFLAASLTCDSAAAVLYRMANAHCGKADVYEDGEYSYSLSVDSAPLWNIFKRTGAPARIDLSGRVLRFPVSPTQPKAY